MIASAQNIIRKTPIGNYLLSAIDIVRVTEPDDIIDGWMVRMLVDTAGAAQISPDVWTQSNVGHMNYITKAFCEVARR